jgi:hypothetical protein
MAQVEFAQALFDSAPVALVAVNGMGEQRQSARCARELILGFQRLTQPDGQGARTCPTHYGT